MSMRSRMDRIFGRLSETDRRLWIETGEVLTEPRRADQLREKLAMLLHEGSLDFGDRAMQQPAVKTSRRTLLPNIAKPAGWEHQTLRQIDAGEIFRSPDDEVSSHPNRLVSDPSPDELYDRHPNC
jgi:hypothetical protein